MKTNLVYFSAFLLQAIYQKILVIQQTVITQGTDKIHFKNIDIVIVQVHVHV